MTPRDWIEIIGIGLAVIGAAATVWWRLATISANVNDILNQLDAMWCKLGGNPCSDHETRIAVNEKETQAVVRRVDRLENEKETQAVVRRVDRLETVRLSQYPVPPPAE